MHWPAIFGSATVRAVSNLTSSPPPARLAGVAWILAASIGFTAMGAFTKLAIGDAGAYGVVFWRSIIVALVALVMMRLQGISLRPGNVRLLAWRSGVGVVAMLLFFWSLGEIPLGASTTLLYTSPVFTVLLSGRVLGEQRDRWTLPLALLAFAGVVMVVRPSALGVDLGTVAALASGFFAALAYVAVRGLRSTDPPARIVFWFSIFAIVVTAVPTSVHGLPSTGTEWLVLLGVGAAASFGQLAMTTAYRLERASIIGPLSYATVVLSYVLGLVFWAEVLSPWATAGMVVVVAAGVGLGRRAHAQAPQRQNDGTDRG